MTMMKVGFGGAAPVELNGVPVAAVTGVSEYETRSEKAITGFGDSEPSAVIAFGHSYVVELERECPPPDGVTFVGNDGFSLRIGSMVYSDCRCTEFHSVKTSEGYEQQKIKIIALGRQEEQNG